MHPLQPWSHIQKHRLRGPKMSLPVTSFLVLVIILSLSMAIVFFLIIINQCSISSCNKVQELKSISKILPGSRRH